MATTFTADSSKSRPKSDCYVGYDAVVKGASVVVVHRENEEEYRENDKQALFVNIS
jgi:hypothetical protein